MKLRIKALRSLRWNCSGWKEVASMLLSRVDWDCYKCDGFPYFTLDADGDPEEIPCPNCLGAGKTFGPERWISVLLKDPRFVFEANRALRDFRAEQERAAAGAAT